MPIEYRIDKSRRLVITTGEGVLSNDDLLNHQTQVHSDPTFDPTFAQLIDLRMADLAGLDANSSETLSPPAGPEDRGKIALVVRGEITRALAKMFEGLQDGTGEHFRVFRDLDSPIDWFESAEKTPGVLRLRLDQDRRNASRVSAGADPRVPARVEFTASDVACTGRIVNMSTSGALIAEPTGSLKPKDEADFFFLQSGTKQRLRARGRVIRSGELGFAIRFTYIDKELERLMLAAAGEVTDKG